MAQLLLAGSRYHEIASALGIGTETVKTYAAQVFEAFEARDRLELASFALRRTRAIAKSFADRLDSPYVVSDEIGEVWLMNASAARAGVGGERLPDDVIRAMHSRRTRSGVLWLRGSAFDAGTTRQQRWVVEDAWIDGRTAMILWRVSPMMSR